MDEKNDTHREHEYKRADKQARVQMKIANDGIESFHGLDQSLYTGAGSAWRAIALRCFSRGSVRQGAGTYLSGTSAAFRIECVVHTEFSRQNFVVDEAKRTEAECDPAQPFAGWM